MTLNESPLFNASLRVCGAMKQVKLLLFGMNRQLLYSLDIANRESCSERAGSSLCWCCKAALSWSKGERMSAMFSTGQGRGWPPRSILIRSGHNDFQDHVRRILADDEV